MNRTFTTTDLFLFAFNETLLVDTVMIAKTLENDFFLQSEFNDVVASIDYIERWAKGPSEASIEAILNYSKSKISS